MNEPQLWTDELAYRRVVLRVVLIISIAFCTSAAIANFRLGNVGYGLMALSLAVLATGLLLIHKKTPHLTAWSSIFLFWSFNTVVAGMYLIPLASSLFVWICLVPALSYLLLGLRLGMLFSLTYSLLGIGVLTLRWHLKHPNAYGGAVINISSCVACIWALSHVFESKRAAMVASLQRIASIDPLTGLHNRLHLESVFSQLAKNRRHGQPSITMMLIDLDHFKAVNDTYGHDGGDAVLIHVAALMTEICRGGDWAFRFGGEEFCLLVPSVTQEQARQIAERLRGSIEAAQIQAGSRQLRVSASIGAARWPDDATTIAELYKIVDQRLYLAKETGRNKVVAT
jgi:diguanylate cyclase (GGDEF)-like protein